MRTLVELWNDWWFPPSTGFRLAVCRIIVVGAQLFVFTPSLEKQLGLLAANERFVDPQWLTALISALGPDELLFTPGAFRLLFVVTIGAGALCLIGLLTRPSAFVFALGNWIMVSHSYSYGEEHHVEAIMATFLMLLAFSPSGRRLSVDALLRRRRGEDRAGPGPVETAVWPLKLTQLLIAWSYLSNGVAKLVYGGLEWINGYTLQQYLLSDGLRNDLPLGVELAGHHTLAILMSIGTLLFELFFFLAVLFPRTVPFFLVAGVLMHVGIYFTMGADFWQQMVMYVVFIDFDRWDPRRREQAGAAPVPFAATSVGESVGGA